MREWPCHIGHRNGPISNVCIGPERVAEIHEVLECVGVVDGGEANVVCVCLFGYPYFRLTHRRILEIQTSS